MTKTTASKSTPKNETEPTPNTGPRSGKTTCRKPRPAENGHTLVLLIGPYATKSGKFEVMFTCQCGHKARPYVGAADDLDTARKAHARHVAKTTATTQ